MSSIENTYKSLEDLYIDNRKLVFTFLWHSIKDSEVVEEIASTIWIKVFERGEMFLSKEKQWVKNYLCTMTKTTVSDYFRAEKRVCETTKRMQYDVETIDLWKEEPCSMLEKRVFEENKSYYLEESLKQLSEEEKSLISMKFKQNMSAKEIGEVLGITDGTVRVRQLRTIRKLRTIIFFLIKERGDNIEDYI